MYNISRAAAAAYLGKTAVAVPLFVYPVCRNSGASRPLLFGMSLLYKGRKIYYSLTATDSKTL